MNDEVLMKESWLKNNWKWLLPALLSILFFICIFSSSIAEDTTSLLQAYTDNLLYEKAIEKANQNPEVLATIGKIEPIDKLSIMEGNVVYSNNNNAVVSTIRIRGLKESGKIDIVANRIGKQWNYQKINVRIKKQKEPITVLDLR